MSAAPNSLKLPEYATFQPESVAAEAITRLRLAAGVSVIAETILPLVEATSFVRADWLAIEIQAIWFVLTLALWAATWHPRFALVWKPAVLLFATGLILSAGILSVKGASLAPFMFLLVLLPAGGSILPWAPKWQGGMSSLCLVFGLLFSSQFDWGNHLVISGLSAMVASILGSHLVTAALTRQRMSIGSYVQALALSERKFRKIFETSGSLIAIHSIPDGSIVDVNPAWQRAFGYNGSEVIGTLPGDLGLSPNREIFDQWFNSLKIGDAGAEQLPVVFQGRLGNPVRCVYSWSTLELNGRNCVLVVGQDVTATVQAEEELRRSREVLVNQERLKAVGELASGIAHDLNNSLNALRLRVELLCNDSTLLSRHSDSLHLISRIVRDAASTIGRLQDFARSGHDRPIESVDLKAIINQSVEIAKSTLEERSFLLDRSIRVEVKLPWLPFIVGDGVELRQTFLNLLLNAQDAMARGGTIRITGSVNDEAILVRVEDDGHGIPDEYLERIFDPFFSTKGARGTGLGLSIARASIARLGGTIIAANRPQGGAIFTLTFPVARVRSVRKAPHSSTQVRPRRVMVIDDDPDNLQALSALLESKGHRVIKATSGADGLEQLTQAHSMVDVVFCDLGMPVQNGWDVARQLRTSQAGPILYLVTGWAAEIPADDSRRGLFDAVLAKPVDPKILDELLADSRLGQLRLARRPKENGPLSVSNYSH
jgi:PAS domain S-box-containing protein